MFKKILVSSMLLTGVLGASTALAHTDSVNKVSSSESHSSVASVDASFHYGLVDFNFSTSYTVSELIPVNNDYGAVIGIFSDKPFEYKVTLRNIETNEVRHATATGSFVFGQYRDEVGFEALEDGKYEVTLENPDGTAQQGQIGMYTYGSK